MRRFRGIAIGTILAVAALGTGAAPSGAATPRVETPGPQPAGGEGWRLLADQRDAGRSHWTAIATHQEDYRRMWKHIELDADRPEVDFAAEVVIWFGAAYGSSCPDLRLDDVVIDPIRSLVHATIVVVDPSASCTAAAEPHAFVVAVERDRLPVGPFALQLDADGPPPGWSEERAIVEVDLSTPASVARRQDITRGKLSSEPSREPTNQTGAIVEADVPFSHRFDTACGIEWLGPVNDTWWWTEVPSGSEPFIPPQWLQAVDDTGRLTVTAILRSEPAPTIEAEANGHSVTYITSADPAATCVTASDQV